MVSGDKVRAHVPHHKFHSGMTGNSMQDLESRLGYRFRDRELLLRALTHASANADISRNNERLEFLGDRVLSLIIADLVMAQYPQDAEGQLAPRLNAMVRRETLADVAGEIALGEALILAVAEQSSGGRDKPAILADACEALIAALYLDGGMATARGFIENFWGRRLGEMRFAPADAKSALQEWSQARKLGTPDYQVISREGPDHAPQFVVEVMLPGHPPARGAGASKREAEQAAAGLMLENVKVNE